MAVAVVLAGCVDHPPTPEFRSFAEGVATQDIGWVMLSLTKSGEYYVIRNANPSLQFRGISAKAQGSVAVKQNKLRVDSPRMPIPVPKDLVLTADDPMGCIVLLELPAGEYEFYGYRAAPEKPVVIQSGGSSSIRFESRPFSLRFRSVPGTVTYLGNVNFAIESFDMKFQLADRRERDLALFEKEFPRLQDKARAVQVLR